MSFLTLAFGLGGLAIAFPLIFHLIRRSPRGRQTFSSLMFLEDSPPRLTQRSRLDDWILLLMRIGIISLIALAFMRPFFRTSALLNQGSLVGRQVAILLDRSSSMQREGTWDKAIDIAKKTLRDLRPEDDFSLSVFDARPHVLVSLKRDRRTSTLEEKREIALALLDKESPGWNSTDLAAVLSEAVESLGTVGGSISASPAGHIVLISDMQNGAIIDPLQSLEWPENVNVDVQYVAAKQSGNANLRLLNEPASAENRRVRVTNFAGNENTRFQLRWSTSQPVPGTSDNQDVRVDVVAGTSRTEELKIPMPRTFDRIELVGDNTQFDNTYYFVPPVTRMNRVSFLGADNPDDPEGLLYYLTRALPKQTTNVVSVLPQNDWIPDSLAPVDLVVVAAPVSTTTSEQLKAYATAGGTILAICDTREIASSLHFLGDNVNVSVSAASPKNATSQFRLLIDLDFRHPLLETFSSPQFNDFTKIHFWKTSDVELIAQSARVLARFDNNRPAIWELPIGTGRLIGFASSWRPVDSQLALSSKFVPLLGKLVDLNFTKNPSESSLLIGQNWQVPMVKGTRSGTLLRPDGREEILTDATIVYSQCDVPGIYSAKIADTIFQFAVNLTASESDLEPMPVERLQALGVKVGKSLSPEQELSQAQRLQDTALESRQKFWKWLIATALGLLILETSYAAWKQRRTALQLLGANAQ